MTPKGLLKEYKGDNMYTYSSGIIIKTTIYPNSHESPIEYELCLDGLDVHRFDRSVDWFEYIFHNRRTDDRLEHDVIIGPIANDTIFDILGVISSGFLSSEDALKLLMIRTCTHTPAVIHSLQARRWFSPFSRPG